MSRTAGDCRRRRASARRIASRSTKHKPARPPRLRGRTGASTRTRRRGVALADCRSANSGLRLPRCGRSEMGRRSSLSRHAAASGCTAAWPRGATLSFDARSTEMRFPTCADFCTGGWIQQPDARDENAGASCCASAAGSLVRMKSARFAGRIENSSCQPFATAGGLACGDDQGRRGVSRPRIRGRTGIGGT
jgi:hypothetical protein